MGRRVTGLAALLAKLLPILTAGLLLVLLYDGLGEHIYQLIGPLGSMRW